jgi:hypothetical protein
MPDPTSLIIPFIPARVKEMLADSLVELLADSAERLGGDQIASKIRKFSSRGELLHSIDRALEAGMRRFIAEYTTQDEDLVGAIQGDASFLQSEAVQDALVKLVSRPGAWLREEREAVVYHFDTILPQRVNRERVDKAINFLLRCIAEELWSLPGAQEIREAYSIQFQELSADAQREQVALARQQLQATTQMSADLRQALLQLIGLVEQKVLAAPAPVALLASPRPYHNLPHPTYTQFVGRDDELTWLRQRLSPADRAWQIAITGIGGVGKSALALAIAHEYRQRYSELSPEDRFEAIVWVSAKEEVLTAFGREPADVPERVLHTLEDVYTAIARVLEREDITRAHPNEQYALVEKALKRQRTLLIMDNLESVNDDRIKAFLRNLPPPTKAIITSREGLDVADVKPLAGLPWEKAERLIEEECRVREATLAPQQRKRIFELTIGLPLPIKLAIARTTGGGSFATVERWLGDATGELPEYCVKGQIDLVRKRDPNAGTVLLACALFDREAGASQGALGEIADLSLVDRDKALAQLHRLFLINRKDNHRLWVLPIVQRFVSEELYQKPDSKIITARWLAWLADFAQQHGERSESDTEAMTVLGQEYPNLRTAIFWCRDRETDPDLTLRLCGGAWHYPYRVALHNDLDDILHVWLWAAQTARDEHAKAKALLQLARLRWIQAQPKLALDCLARAEGALEQYGDYADLAEAWATRSSIFRRHGSMDAALLLAHRVYELGRKKENLDITLLGIQEIAEVERRQGNLDQCLDWCQIGISLGRAQGSPRRIVNLEYKRGRVYEQKGQLAEAESVYSETLATATSIGSRRFIAWNKLRLAEVYRATGRSSLAEQIAIEARNLLEGLGLPYALQEVDEFLMPVSDKATNH